MAKMKDILINIMTCHSCYGQGWQFAGNDVDYDIWACECNPYNIPADEVLEFHQLFKTKENA